jgi:D-threo-aldose 1-dehydrogenase
MSPHALPTRPLRTRTRQLDVTVLGFGGAPLGNLYAPISDVDAQATLEAAWDEGMRLFDTAPLYGYGLSEERFARGLAARPRDAFVLSTKVGRVLRDCAPEEVPRGQFHGTPSRTFVYDYSYDGVMRSFEDSLSRLQVDRIDMLLVHDVDAFTHGSREAAETRINELFTEGGYRALETLRSSGAIAGFGAGVNESDICEALAHRGDFDCFLLAGRYTLLEQAALESLLPLCVTRDIGIILGGPFNSGILATGAVPGAFYNYAPAPPDVLARVARLEQVCRAQGVSLQAAALQFVFAHPAIRSVIPGASAPGQVHANAALLRAPIPDAFWQELTHAGLIRPDAPVPARRDVLPA